MFFENGDIVKLVKSILTHDHSFMEIKTELSMNFPLAIY